VQADVRLTFNNCMKYTPDQQSPYHQAALQLRTYFDQVGDIHPKYWSPAAGCLWLTGVARGACGGGGQEYTKLTEQGPATKEGPRPPLECEQGDLVRGAFVSVGQGVFISWAGWGTIAA
jgi:hypothetical protein